MHYSHYFSLSVLDAATIMKDLAALVNAVEVGDRHNTKHPSMGGRHDAHGGRDRRPGSTDSGAKGFQPQKNPNCYVEVEASAGCTGALLRRKLGTKSAPKACRTRS